MTVFYVVYMYQIVLDDMGLQAFYGSVLCGIHIVLAYMGLLALHDSVLCGIHVSYCPY